MEQKKVLLRISNLKQYFPLKKTSFKDKEILYVKANDGISLEIYEGETFGLVGESGCGKPPLGGRFCSSITRPTAKPCITAALSMIWRPVMCRTSSKICPSGRRRWKNFGRSMKSSMRNTKPSPKRKKSAAMTNVNMPKKKRMTLSSIWPSSSADFSSPMIWRRCPHFLWKATTSLRKFAIRGENYRSFSWMLIFTPTP